MSELTCKSREAALATLGTIAESLPSGTQRQALAAVAEWIRDTVSSESAEERDKILRDIFFSETEGERLGREWWNRGSRKLQSGEWANTEPADGALWKCRWNAKTKQWEPPFPPPLKNLPKRA
jgi:hypothetical protein